MSLPRGWNSKIGVALKIGVVVVAAASDAGEVADLPAPCPAAVAAWGGENGGSSRSSAERQGDLVNAAFDGLAGAVPDKSNDLVDSAFMDAESEVRWGVYYVPISVRVLFCSRVTICLRHAKTSFVQTNKLMLIFL